MVLRTRGASLNGKIIPAGFLKFGLALARGVPPAGAAAAIGQVVEGVETSARVMRLARRFRVEIPICEQVRAVVTGASSPVEAVETLLARDAAGPER